MVSYVYVYNYSNMCKFIFAFLHVSFLVDNHSLGYQCVCISQLFYQQLLALTYDSVLQ